MKLSGIYLIKNMINGKGYIGSSSNIIPRKRCHFSELRRNIHGNSHLQNSVNKYGIDNFNFYIITLCDTNELINKEKFYINYLKSEYNIKDPEVHAPLSEEHKRKIGEANKGKPRSQELRDRIREINTGKKQSIETIEKRKESFKKILDNKDHGWNYGSKHTEEANLAKSIRQTGRKINITDERKYELRKNIEGVRRMRIPKKVYQYSLDNKLIKEFDSAKEAVNILNKPSCSLNNALCGQKPTAYGFKWSYNYLVQ